VLTKNNTSLRESEAKACSGGQAHQCSRGAEDTLQREIGALTEAASTSTFATAETVVAPREKTQKHEPGCAIVSVHPLFASVR
jgi:hypothetical protein